MKRERKDPGLSPIMEMGKFAAMFEFKTPVARERSAKFYICFYDCSLVYIIRAIT